MLREEKRVHGEEGMIQVLTGRQRQTTMACVQAYKWCGHRQLRVLLFPCV